MKKLISSILISCLALSSFVGCSNNDDKFVIATNATFYPYEYLGSDNEIVGVDIDIANAIAEEAGKELKIDNVEFISALTAASTGNADIAIAGITVNEERKETLDFSEPYATSVQYIVVKEDSDVKTIEDLAGMKIGVQNGTTSNIIIEEEINGSKDDDGNHITGVLENTGASLQTYKSALLAALDLTTGTVDAVVVDQLPAENIVSENEGLKCFELVYSDGTTTKEEYAIAVKKGDTQTLELVNKVIKQLKEQGKIDEFLLNHLNAQN